MTNRTVSMPTHTARIAMKTEPEFRDRVIRAAEVRDGGNVSRFIRRAVDRLIEEESLLAPKQESAA